MFRLFGFIITADGTTGEGADYGAVLPADSRDPYKFVRPGFVLQYLSGLNMARSD